MPRYRLHASWDDLFAGRDEQVHDFSAKGDAEAEDKANLWLEKLRDRIRNWDVKCNNDGCNRRSHYHGEWVEIVAVCRDGGLDIVDPDRPCVGWDH